MFLLCTAERFGLLGLLYTIKVENSKMDNFSVVGEPLTNACSLKFTLHLSLQFESLVFSFFIFYFLTILPMLTSCLTDPVWNDYDKPSPKILSYLLEISWEYWEFELLFCGSQTNVISSILLLVMKLATSKHQTPENCKFELSTWALVWKGPIWQYVGA